MMLSEGGAKMVEHIINVEKGIKKRKCKGKIRLQLRKNVEQVLVSLALQRLFSSCKRVFNGSKTVPSSVDVQNLCHILDHMKPEDVGLNSDLQFFKVKSEVEGTPRVTSATIYKCQNFELSIFFLPANAVIPLHNHPEMTVFSKLLLGTMHIKAYDWVEPQPLTDPNCSTSPSKGRLAKLKSNRTFTAPSDASVLYPTSGGNIHEFTAITPCAFLDVIGPPYSKDDGRDCSYYKVKHEEDGEDGKCSYGWLEEIEIPIESEMDAIEYMGPQIIKSFL